MGNRSAHQHSDSKDSSSPFSDSSLSQRLLYWKQISLGDLSNTSRKSNGSNRCRMQKPLCKVSRRRRRDCTFSEISGVSKTVWPVKVSESLFLPEFKIKCDINENNFKICEEIGRGAFSQVFRVEMADSGEEYAMKVIAKAKILEENSIHQVKDEVMIQSSCGHHPFIAACKYYWQSHRFVFIVSELVCGGELWELVNRYRTLPEDLVRIYIAEIAVALDFLHNAGVIYRDLKLENIVLDAHGHVKLIDFGLSKRLKYGTRTSTICGTLQFMAPEVFEGSYSHAADWWSLGVISYLLLNGEYPSIVQRRMAQLEQTQRTPDAVEEQTISTPESGSVAARDLTSRLLLTDPQQRLRSLMSLKTIAFFKGFSFDDVLAKKISPNDLLPISEFQSPFEEDVFEDFDSSSV